MRTESKTSHRYGTYYGNYSRFGTDVIPESSSLKIVNTGKWSGKRSVYLILFVVSILVSDFLAAQDRGSMLDGIVVRRIGWELINQEPVTVFFKKCLRILAGVISGSVMDQHDFIGQRGQQTIQKNNSTSNC